MTILPLMSITLRVCLRINLRRDFRDPSIVDRHGPGLVQSLGWIDEHAAREHQVVHRGIDSPILILADMLCGAAGAP